MMANDFEAIDVDLDEQNEGVPDAAQFNEILSFKKGDIAAEIQSRLIAVEFAMDDLEEHGMSSLTTEIEIVKQKPYLFFWEIIDWNTFDDGEEADYMYSVSIYHQNIEYGISAPLEQRVEVDAIIAALGF